MKKICIIFLATIIIILSAVGLTSKQTTSQTEYLRIHIRANSNLEKDQTVKYDVRDKVVAYLTPLVAESKDKKSAETMLTNRLGEIERVAEETLRSRGVSYQVKAAVRTENFPTRVYGEYTLPAGEYRALILYLGEGKGDNWWCVVYPPLCFNSLSSGVVYQSKIAEIIKKWQAGKR